MLLNATVLLNKKIFDRLNFQDLSSLTNMPVDIRYRYLYIKQERVMRTIVTIPDNQIKEIAALCHEQHISRSELIRLSLSAYIKSYKATRGNKEKAFGILQGNSIHAAIKHQDQLRSEWD